jgi:hypothetical protein
MLLLLPPASYRAQALCRLLDQLAYAFESVEQQRAKPLLNYSSGRRSLPS